MVLAKRIKDIIESEVNQLLFEKKLPLFAIQHYKEAIKHKAFPEPS